MKKFIKFLEENDHGLDEKELQDQANSLGLKVHIVKLPNGSHVALNDGQLRGKNNKFEKIKTFKPQTEKPQKQNPDKLSPQAIVAKGYFDHNAQNEKKWKKKLF